MSCGSYLIAVSAYICNNDFIFLQAAAPRLKAFGSMLGKFGNTVGIVGYGVSATVIAYKLANKQPRPLGYIFTR